MANYNKQFNFRNGVQVDNNKFIVSPTGLVGIGTTIPTEALEIADGGNVKVSGFLTATSIFAQSLTITGGQGIIVNDVTSESIVGGGVSIKSGIVSAMNPLTGIVTYYGDATYLQGMPTSQWVDIDAGLGYTSIYAAGNVGIATVDPRFTFQVGGNTDTTVAGFSSGVGINSTGDVLITGVTTSGEFVGGGSGITGINAANIASGTISADRLPTLSGGNIPSSFEVTGIITAGLFNGNLVGTGVSAGIITATTEFKGSLTGTASTALSLSGTPNIEVDIATATEFKGPLTGTATTASSLTGSPDITVNVATAATVVSGIGSFTSIGIQTSEPSADLQIRKESGIALLEVISDTNRASINIGNSVNAGTNSASIFFGSDSAFGVYSTEQSFNITNQDTGNLNYFLNNSVSSDSGFRWHKGATNLLMSLTGDGHLGIGKTDPEHYLDVQGISTFTGNAYFVDDVTIEGILTIGSLAADVTGDLIGNVNTTTGISTFNDIKASSVGIGTTITRGVLDLKDAGDGFNNFVLVPGITASVRNSLSPIVEGALIYNKGSKRLELYDGNGWVGIATEV